MALFGVIVDAEKVLSVETPCRDDIVLRLEPCRLRVSVRFTSHCNPSLNVLHYPFLFSLSLLFLSI